MLTFSRLAALLIVLAVAACAAPEPPPVMSRQATIRAEQVFGHIALPAEPVLGQLDGALRRGDGATLNRLLDSLPATQRLDWLGTRHYGGWVEASGFYVRETFAIGTRQRQEGLRETAVLMWLYMIALGQTDLQKCADRSAGGYVDRLFQRPFDEIGRLASTLPRERLETLARTAITMEAAIAPDRAPHGFVCTFTVAGTVSPGSPPRLRPQAEWMPRAEAARRDLPAFMGNVVDGLSRPR